MSPKLCTLNWSPPVIDTENERYHGVSYYGRVIHIHIRIRDETRCDALHMTRWNSMIIMFIGVYWRSVSLRCVGTFGNRIGVEMDKFESWSPVTSKLLLQPEVARWLPPAHDFQDRPNSNVVNFPTRYSYRSLSSASNYTCLTCGSFTDSY